MISFICVTYLLIKPNLHTYSSFFFFCLYCEIRTNITTKYLVSILNLITICVRFREISPLNITRTSPFFFQKEKQADSSQVVLLAEFDETVLGSSDNKQVDPVECCVDFDFTCCLNCSNDAQTLTNIAQKPIICKMRRPPDIE